MRLLPCLIALLALPCRGQVPSTAMMEGEVRAFEAEHAQGRALLAVVRGRADQVASAADLESLAAQELAEFGRVAKLVDDIFRRRNRFRVQANGLQVAVLAAQVIARRPDKAAYDGAIRYREANDRMTEAFISLESANHDAHQAFLRRLSLEKDRRSRARFTRRVKGAVAAAVLLGGLLLALRRKRRPSAPAPNPPLPHLRPKGPGRLE